MDDAFLSFIEQLRRDLAGPLPGPLIQYRMAPRPRNGGEISDPIRTDARRGGVLVLLYPDEGQIRLPLILRSTYEGVHSGQVGFPGGGYEACDADLTATALREAKEEIGVAPELVEVVGKLSPLYVNASNYLVQPVVAWVKERPTFCLDPYEVAKLLEVSIPDLLDPSNRYQEKWQLRNRTAEVPFFRIQNQVIWGATAMMLSELLALTCVEEFERRGGGETGARAPAARL